VRNAVRRTWLSCSCCGNASWFGEQDPQHDKGFGTCVDCLHWTERDNDEEWDRLEDRVATALCEENREEFLSFGLGVRRGIMLGLMDAGAIEWTIKR